VTALAVLLGVLLVVALVVIGLLATRLRRLDRLVDETAELLDVDAGPGAGSVDGPRRLRRAGNALLAELEASRADVDHLQQSLYAIPQGVVLCDADRRVVFRNAIAEGYAGARHGDALVEAAIEEVLGDASSGLPAERTIDLFGPPRRTLVITGRPIGGGAQGPVGALAVIEDVSERRRLDAVRRDFVANISHELRTPVGALGLLAETILGEDDPAVRDRLAQRMLSETDRVARTIDDLLTLSRIESEELPEREPVAAGLVMAEAADRIRPAAEQRNIEILVQEPSDRLAIFGDRRQLVSALYNLLDNAVKYSDPGQRVEVHASTDGRTVDLTVQDHGIGIPASDLNRIFERFYRVDQARSRQTGGTGLGLAIVRHVASNHDGEVVVQSTVGAGSAFTLRLPTAASGPVALDTAEAS
jgi:two-component system sensor histidine kinase SenX3